MLAVLEFKTHSYTLSIKSIYNSTDTYFNVIL